LVGRCQCTIATLGVDRCRFVPAKLNSSVSRTHERFYASISRRPAGWEGSMRRDDDLGVPDDRDRARETDGRTPPEPARAGITPRQILIGVFVVVLVVFAIANFNRVEVNFLLFQTRARVITVVVVAGALGFLIGYLVGRPSREDRRFLRKRGE
jgi:uncharacterized integral membrane protein